MRYNLTHEFSADPAVVAAADQLNAPVYEAERIAPHNGQMIHDPRIEELIRWNARGQYAGEHEFFDSEVVPHVGVVVAVPAGHEYDRLAQAVPADGGPVTRALAAPCVLCGNPQSVTASYRVFWIACGRTILEVVLCAQHAQHHVERFDAVPLEAPVGAM